jgi:hypothetical protein
MKAEDDEYLSESARLTDMDFYHGERDKAEINSRDNSSLVGNKDDVKKAPSKKKLKEAEEG